MTTFCILSAAHAGPHLYAKQTSAVGWKCGVTRCSPKHALRDYVVIAQTALGHPLPKGAVVHHVNRDRSDNAHSNIVVCQDQAYHMLLHARQRVVDAGGDPGVVAICCTCHTMKLLAEFSGQKNRSRACTSCVSARRIELRVLKGLPVGRVYLSEVRQRVVNAGGDPDKVKICTRCKRLVEFAGFYPDRTASPAYGGVGRDCRQCLATRIGRRFVNNTESDEDAEPYWAGIQECE